MYLTGDSDNLKFREFVLNVLSGLQILKCFGIYLGRTSLQANPAFTSIGLERTNGTLFGETLGILPNPKVWFAKILTWLSTNPSILACSMNIVHVVYSCVPGRFRGGISKIVFELASAQRRAGHHVRVFSTNIHGDGHWDQDSSVVNEVEFRYFDEENKRWYSSRELNSALSSLESVDVIHGHSPFLAPNVYARKAAAKHNAKLFYHTHGSLDGSLIANDPIVKRLRKRLYIGLLESRNYQNADCLFANTNHEKSQIKHFFPNMDITVVPNGIKPIEPPTAEERNNQRRQRGWEDKFVVLFIGRIVVKKLVHTLVESIHLASKNVPQIHLAIAGDPNQDVGYTARVKKTISDLGLENRVEWLGFVDEEEKPKILGAADLFSHVTSSEGMPMSVLEAASAGLPVVVSDKCYLDDAVKAGALVECSTDSSDLAETITELASSPELRESIGTTGRNFMIENRSWNTVADTIEKSYAG